MLSFSYTSKNLASIVKAELSGPDVNIVLNELLWDSRKANHFAHTLFIAIKGPHHDGHDYIEDLYQKGFRHFLICDEKLDKEQFSEATFLIVEDSLKALQKLAEHHRSQFNIPIIGITGSNGKTIVKEWLSICLQTRYKICKSPKSYNSQIGLPLSILNLESTHQIGLFEAGISLCNEMERLEKIMAPTIGIFTNIGEAHSENFSSLEEKVAEKAQLFKNAKQIIYCSDHDLIHQELKKIDNIQLINWSQKDESAWLYVKSIKEEEHQSKITIQHKGIDSEFQIPFSDDASIENCLHLMTLLKSFDLGNKDIQSGLKQLQPLAMRLELKEAKSNSLLINDAYSSDLSSLKIALDFHKQQSGNLRKIAILSELDETGMPSSELFPKLMSLLDNYQIEKVVGIGEKFCDFQAIFNNCQSYKDTESFLAEIEEQDFGNASILIKGARRFQFENIAKALEQKAHETVLEVNLNAISHNFHSFKRLLKPETKVMVMVKAFSYGNGSFEIAHTLQYHNADYLAVAYVDEGIALRKKGIHLPIMVLNPDSASFKRLIDRCLEPEIYSFRQLNAFRAEVANTGLKGYPIHLKLDTGMRRLGFESAQIEELILWLNQQEELSVKSVFSHLASSDLPEDEAFTQIQIDEYRALCQALEIALNQTFTKHILNSSGIINYPEAQFDMVRLGIGLYGIGADEKLQNCSALKTVISQIKTVNIGESVGYSRSYTADETIRIAIVPIGYADGLNRALSNGKGVLYVKGKRASIIGNVCMDMCMIDINHIDAKEGDEVIVWSSQQHIEEMAESLNTIAYEVLTNVSQRVKRVFLQD